MYYLQLSEILCDFTTDLPRWKKSSDPHPQPHPTTTTQYCFHVRKRDGKVVMYLILYRPFHLLSPAAAAAAVTTGRPPKFQTLPPGGAPTPEGAT